MKKTIYVCDHCGKEFSFSDGYVELEIDNFDFVEEVDLCTGCFQELSGKVKDFIRKSK